MLDPAAVSAKAAKLGVGWKEVLISSSEAEVAMPLG